MLNGSLIGQVTGAPQGIEKTGQGFMVSTGGCEFAVLVTHALAGKAMKQVELGKTVFLRVRGVQDGRLHADALEVLRDGTELWNTFTICGTVLVWPTAGQHPEVQVEVDTLSVLLRVERALELSSVGPSDGVQAWGVLACQDGAFILTASRLERLQWRDPQDEPTQTKK